MFINVHYSSLVHWIPWGPAPRLGLKFTSLQWRQTPKNTKMQCLVIPKLFIEKNTMTINFHANWSSQFSLPIFPTFPDEKWLWLDFEKSCGELRECHSGWSWPSHLGDPAMRRRRNEHFQFFQNPTFRGKNTSEDHCHILHHVATLSESHLWTGISTWESCQRLQWPSWSLAICAMVLQIPPSCNTGSVYLIEGDEAWWSNLIRDLQPWLFRIARILDRTPSDGKKTEVN